MITRERMEELREKNIPIYIVWHNQIFNVSWENISVDRGNWFRLFPLTDDGPPIIFSLDSIFETEEAAYWKSISFTKRWENLEFLSYEELQKELKFSGYEKRFHGPEQGNRHYELYISGTEEEGGRIHVQEFCGNILIIDLFTRKNTKENYIEAIQYCIKLFNGEV